MAQNDNATLVVGAGNFYTAPVGTAFPNDITSAPPEPWESVGHTSLEDIFSFTSEGGETTTLGTLQAKAFRSSVSPRTESFGINIHQFDRKSLRLYFGANAPVLPNGLVGAPQAPTPTVCAFLAIFIDAENVFAIYVPRCEIFRREDIEIQDAESLVQLPLSIKPLIYGNNTWPFAVTPLGGIEATGATAGTPGIFTPPGADVPYSLEDLAGVTADPATAWTAGQYVELEDGSTAYWDGDSWAAGIAPGE